MKENFCYKCGSDYESEYYKYDNILIMNYVISI